MRPCQVTVIFTFTSGGHVAYVTTYQLGGDVLPGRELTRSRSVGDEVPSVIRVTFTVTR